MHIIFFDKINDCRFAYVGNDTDENWHTYFKNYQKRNKISITSVFEPNLTISSATSIGSLSDYKSSYKDPRCNPLQFPSEEKASNICKINIKIEDYDSYTDDEIVNKLLKELEEKCKENTDNAPRLQQKITVSDGMDSSCIYLLNLSNDVTNHAKVSIFFNIHVEYARGNCSAYEKPDRSIFCFDNAPGSILSSLRHQLQYNLIKGSAIVELENLRSMGNIDYVVEEAYGNIKFCHPPINYMYDSIEYLYPLTSNYEPNAQISLKDILDFQIHKPTAITKILRPFAEKSGISETEIALFILKSVFNKNDDVDCSRNVLKEFDYNTDIAIGLFITEQEEGKLVLNLCELKSLGYSRAIAILSSKMLGQCLKAEESMTIPIYSQESFVKVLQNKRLSSHVVNDFIAHLHYDDEYCIVQFLRIGDAYADEAVDRLSNNFYNRYISAYEPSDDFADTSTTKMTEADFKKTISGPIRKLATLLQEEMADMRYRYKGKVSSILLKSSAVLNEISQTDSPNVIAKYYEDIGLLRERE